MAYVVDPKLLFQMQGDGSIAQTGLGNNVQAISTAGSTSIGRSKNALTLAHSQPPTRSRFVLWTSWTVPRVQWVILSPTRCDLPAA